MGQRVVNVGSFDKSSSNGVTAYGTTMYFTIPENAGITGCSVTFVTHNSGGHTHDRAFSLNGARAHSSGSWASSGIALNAALLSTGQNTFRVTLKSRAGAACWWDIGSITLTITYNDVSGGGGSYDIGTLSVNKTSMTAGDSLTVSVGSASAGVYRDISIFLLPSSAGLAYVAQGHGSGAGSWAVTIPESWCAAYSPNDPSFEIRIYVDAYITGGTPVGNTSKMVAVNVPATAVPTIDDFTAVLNANGVDASITGYVQNYSKVSLAMDSVAGALGSSIQSYEITGAGFSAAAASAAFGPFAQTGDITFTAKVTDTRGRTATRTVSINVLSYGPAVFSNPEAWRSSDVGVKNQKGTYARLKSGVSYSSLDGQNSVTLKGRVYPKGGAVPAYTSMTPDTEWITGGGLLLFTKTYIAQMEVSDLIGSRAIEFTIPTKKTGISIMAGMQGIAFGKSAEIPGVSESAWPIVAPGLAPNPNLLHNADFRNPVNQRDVSGAISSGSYFFDRWIRNSGTVTVAAGYLTLASGAVVEQRIEGLYLAGETVTISAMVGSTIYNGTGVFPTSAGTAAVTLTGFGTATLGYNTGYMFVLFTASGSQNVVAVKCELGAVSTLHLDPPMDHAVELPKCLRFYRELPQGTKLAGIIFSSTAYLQYQLDPPMRIAPTIGTLPNIYLNWSAGGSGNVSVLSSGSTAYRLEVGLSAGVASGPVTGETNGKITLSSDL